MRRTGEITVKGCALKPAAVEVGRRLFALRDKKNWSMQTVADKSGLSLGTISKVENGQHYPHPRTANKLAKAFKVSVEFLRHGETADGK